MSGKKFVEDLQPPLYLYGAKKEFGIMPKSFTLHYLHPDKHIVYEKVGDMAYQVKTSRNTYTLDVSGSLEKTKDLLNGIKQQKFSMPSTATHEWRCSNMCWFGLSGKCAGTQQETWKTLNDHYKKAVLQLELGAR